LLTRSLGPLRLPIQRLNHPNKTKCYTEPDPADDLFI